MPFDVEAADLGQLEKEFQRLADSRGTKFASFTAARSALETQLTEYQEIYGKIEVINAISTELLGDDPVTDGSPGDDPFGVDFLDRVDDVFAIGGGVAGFASLLSLGYKIRQANLAGAGALADNAADVAAITWPKLRLFGGVLGLGISALGIALMVRDHQERMSFYKENIPIYEAWAADLAAKTTSFDDSRTKLNEDLDDLQTKLGYASREEMKNELKRTVGDVAEYRSQWIALTKMLCNSVSIADAISYTGFPSALVNRRAQEIAQDSSICSTVMS